MVSYLIRLHWNISIADMLYSGHFSVADTIFENQLPIFYWHLPLYNGHLFREKMVISIEKPTVTARWYTKGFFRIGIIITKRESIFYPHLFIWIKITWIMTMLYPPPAKILTPPQLGLPPSIFGIFSTPSLANCREVLPPA